MKLFMFRRRIVPFLVFLVCTCFSLSLNPKELPPEFQQKIAEHFLNKTVIAKISMPMTTSGVTTSWDGNGWSVNANLVDQRLWGVGVQAGSTYSITAVKFERDRVEIWLNDGGMINTFDQIADSWIWAGNQIDQIKHNQEMQEKRSSANGSRVKIYLGDINIQGSILAALNQAAKQFFEFTDLKQSNETKSNFDGKLIISSNPESPELYVDGSFVGNAPAKLSLSQGKHNIRAMQDGFGIWEREVTVLGDSEVNIKIVLPEVGNTSGKPIIEKTTQAPDSTNNKQDPAKGILSVRSDPEGASVFLNETYAGKTPLRIELPLGDYRVRVFLFGYKEWADDLQLINWNAVGNKVELDIRLSK